MVGKFDSDGIGCVPYVEQRGIEGEIVSCASGIDNCGGLIWFGRGGT